MSLQTEHVPAPREFLIALDFSESSRYALEWFVEHNALYSHDTLRLLSVSQEPSGQIGRKARENFDPGLVESEVEIELRKIWEFVGSKHDWIKNQIEARQKWEDQIKKGEIDDDIENGGPEGWFKVRFEVHWGKPQQTLVNLTNSPAVSASMSANVDVTSEDSDKKSRKILKPTLLVMGSHGRSCQVKQALGSVSDWCLRNSAISVLVVKEPSIAERIEVEKC